MPTRISDPALSFQYGVFISSPIPITGYFTEFSGLSEEQDVIKHKVIQSDGSEYIYMIPGRWEPNPITLKRGTTWDSGFWQWRNLVRRRNINLARANVTIFLYDRDYTPVMAWNLFEAWPSKLSGPEFKADSSEIAVEELTLVYEDLEAGV
ncbi:MAG: phage tail protein [Chloroflexota bacterium]